MLARDLMTLNPAFCLPQDNCRKAAHLMREVNCGLIPVVADKNSMRLVGVVTDRDLTIRVLATDRNPDDLTVGQVMTKDPITVTPGDDVKKVEQLMEEHRVRRIPVVEGDMRLVGIIAQADLARKVSEHEVAEVVRVISEPTRQAHL